VQMSMCIACLGIVLAAGQAATKDTTKWRCRNRKLSCKKWAADNQCTANYPFMAEECPAACDLCTNAGLVATPAPFELDYVCRGKLQPVPAQLEEAAHAPDGCGFKCRDNMTSVCAQEAGRDACKTHPEVMRVQCPATCGVCKALGVRVSTEAEYPKPSCDDAEQPPACAGWAASGECVKNFPFMSQTCGRSCGLCGAAKAAEEPAAAASATAVKKTGSKGKKKKKKVAKPDAVAPEAEAAQPAAEDEQPAGHGSGGGDGAKPAKRGFVSSVKAALGKVGKAFKGGKKADKPASKAEL